MAYGCFSPGFDTPHPGLRGRRRKFASMSGELTRGRIARSKIFFPPIEKIRTKYSFIRWRQNRPGILVGGATRMSYRHNPGSRRRQSPASVFSHYKGRGWIECEGTGPAGANLNLGSLFGATPGKPLTALSRRVKLS